MKQRTTVKQEQRTITKMKHNEEGTEQQENKNVLAKVANVYVRRVRISLCVCVGGHTVFEPIFKIPTL
jgi:hypothetical protein